MHGLVLNGGGGKGAYQIGVWRYFQEKNITFDMISGTSAGGLNAALIAQGDLDIAMETWKTIEPDKVKKIDRSKIVNTAVRLASEIVKMLALKKSSKSTLVIKEVSRNLGRLLQHQAVLQYLLTEGIYSTNPLRQLIRNTINFKKISDYPAVYLTIVRNHPIYIYEGRRYIHFNVRHPALMELLLYATSALPIVFPNTDIGNIKYGDGGIPIVGDNSPVSPLYLRSCENIVVVHLIPGAKSDRTRFPNARIIDIAPDQKLGGTLNIEGKHAEHLMDLGYSDAKKVYEGYNKQ